MDHHKDHSLADFSDYHNSRESQGSPPQEGGGGFKLNLK